MILEAIDTDIYENDELKHWGIIGMKWGIRRYQNPDGSLTPEGRERYGVGTAAETKKLSYSQEYEVLKNKKNRTEKEEETFKRLKEGKKYFEASAKDPDYWNKFKGKNDYVQNELALDKYREYLATTNYGKGMISAGAMMSIPTTALGAAVDVGALFIEDRMGLPFYITGLGISTMLPLGLGLGGQLYEDKNLSKLQEELKNTKNENKQFERKQVGLDQYTVSTKDIINDMENDLLKGMGLDRRDGNTYKDIVIDSDGYIRRKDGKDFVYYIDGKKQTAGFFNEIALDWKWAADNGHDFSIDPPNYNAKKKQS